MSHWIRIQLTQGQTTLIDYCDRDLRWDGWIYCKGRNGGYAKRHGPHPTRRLISLHNVIARRMGIVGEADHCNRDTLDNRRFNLRASTRRQNCLNRRRRRDNVSGYKGVGQHRGQWRARITVEGKTQFLGYFATKKRAANAYNEAAIRYHKEFACLNEITP